tara:strand:+ start:220 stop:423 length:204 start_codon:yes stop_codon:yes gene_type:complete
MSFNKKNFYLHTPSGEMMLVEAFLRDENMTILFGQENRIDLNLESAFELADCLLLLLSDTGMSDEEH